MTPEQALNWLASRAADAPVTIRTAAIDAQVYETAVKTLAAALTEWQKMPKTENAITDVNSVPDGTVRNVRG